MSITIDHAAETDAAHQAHHLIDVLAAHVPEIGFGCVDIAAIATEPGIGTKVAVRATVAGLDPVATCIGRAGVRIRDVVRETGEHIAIVAHDDDPLLFIQNAIEVPAVTAAITNPMRRRATLTIEPDLYSRALGRAGGNLRQAQALTGWSVRLRPATEPELLCPNAARTDKESA